MYPPTHPITHTDITASIDLFTHRHNVHQTLQPQTQRPPDTTATATMFTRHYSHRHNVYQTLQPQTQRPPDTTPTDTTSTRHYTHRHNVHQPLQPQTQRPPDTTAINWLLATCYKRDREKGGCGDIMDSCWLWVIVCGHILTAARPTYRLKFTGSSDSGWLPASIAR